MKKKSSKKVRQTTAKKPIIFQIPLPPYKTGVHVYICTVKQMDKFYKETVYCKDTPDMIFHQGGGKAIYVEGTRPIIWVDSTKPRVEVLSALVHEFSHVAAFVLDDRGVMLSAGNLEPFTYLMEMCVLEAFNKLKWKLA